jgi:hypothetical protein
MRPVVTALLCAALPAIGLIELALANAQAKRVPRDEDWRAAAAAASAQKKPGDWVIVAPQWAGPLGRKAIGEVDPKLITLASVARSDLDTVPRVLELSIRKHDDPQTRGWQLLSEQAFGTVKLRTLQNPKPDILVRDLVDEMGPNLTVGRANAAGAIVEPCRWESGPTRIPNLFQGPATPIDRWMCPPNDPVWTFVGVTTITDLDYNPRRCILMHPTEGTHTIVRYPPGKIGKKVVAYVGIHVFQERDLNKPPVHASVQIAGKEVAHTRHKDGDGWLRFEGTTADLAGQSLPVELHTWAEGSYLNRLTCVAAQLRD